MQLFGGVNCVGDRGSSVVRSDARSYSARSVIRSSPAGRGSDCWNSRGSRRAVAGDPEVAVSAVAGLVVPTHRRRQGVEATSWPGQRRDGRGDAPLWCASRWFTVSSQSMDYSLRANPISRPLPD